MNKPIKKLQKLKGALEQLDHLRDVMIKVIEQGGDVCMEWDNDGIENIPSCSGPGIYYCNGAQTFTFKIPPHNTKK